MPGDHKDPEILQRLYHEVGLTLEQMADELGVAKTTVQYQMKKHDIPRRIPGSRVEDGLVLEEKREKDLDHPRQKFYRR